MKKPFDYYAGYPGQQETPKWVGVTLGSLFGGMLLVAVGLGVHVFAPARSAQASTVAKATESPIAAPVVAAAPADEVAPAEAPIAAAPAVHKATHRAHGKHVARAMKPSSKPAFARTDAKFKKAQLYAKSVSRRDKKSRDDLDRLLGL